MLLLFLCKHISVACSNYSAEQAGKAGALSLQLHVAGDVDMFLSLIRASGRGAIVFVFARQGLTLPYFFPLIFTDPASASLEMDRLGFHLN